MTAGPVNVTVREGQEAVFSCGSSGSVLWLVNCKNISAVEGSTASIGSDGRRILMLTGERGQNGAKITCVVDGMLVGSAILTVLCEYEISLTVYC